MYLRLYQNGSEILKFNSGNIVIGAYEMRSMAADVEWVEEEITLAIKDTLANIQTFLQTLNRAFMNNRQAQEASYSVNTLYLQIDVARNDTWWESAILSGEAIRGAQVGNFVKLSGGKITLRIKRKNFWRKASAVAIPLNNVNYTGDNTGEWVRFFGCNDLTGAAGYVRCNYVDIKASRLTDGDLPGEIKSLELSNLQGSGINIGKLWMSINARGTPDDAAAKNNFELDDIAEGTKTSDSNCSGGYRRDVTLAATAETKIASLVISRSNWYKLGENDFRVFVRLAEALGVDDLQLRVKVERAGIAWLETPWQLIDATHQMIDLGVLQLRTQHMDLGTVELCLYGKKISASTYTIKLDYLQLMPMLDGFNLYTCPTPIDYNLLGGSKIIDVQSYEQNRVYGNTDTYGYVNDVVRYGNAPLLYPGKLHRLTFLWMQETGAHIVSGPCNIAVLNYSPRRRII